MSSMNSLSLRFKSNQRLDRHTDQNVDLNQIQERGGGGKKKIGTCSFITTGTRQIIRYRATATLRRPQNKQYSASK